MYYSTFLLNFQHIICNTNHYILILAYNPGKSHVHNKNNTPMELRCFQVILYSSIAQCLNNRILFFKGSQSVSVVRLQAKSTSHRDIFFNLVALHSNHLIGFKPILEKLFKLYYLRIGRRHCRIVVTMFIRKFLKKVFFNLRLRILSKPRCESRDGSQYSARVRPSRRRSGPHQGLQPPHQPGPQGAGGYSPFVARGGRGQTVCY